MKPFPIATAALCALSEEVRLHCRLLEEVRVYRELLISAPIPCVSRSCYNLKMCDLVILLVQVIVTFSRLLGPGGIRSVVAELVLIKQQLLILNRSRQRAPNLRASDRFVAGLCALFMQPTRLIRSAIVLKPSTLLNLHQALRKRRYRILFSPERGRKPGPKGPSRELIDAIVDTKQRNPSWGCPRIAQQVALAFGSSIKTLSDASWPTITDQSETPADRPGLPFWVR
jgi:hypothetical protein